MLVIQYGVVYVAQPRRPSLTVIYFGEIEGGSHAPYLVVLKLALRSVVFTDEREEGGKPTPLVEHSRSPVRAVSVVGAVLAALVLAMFSWTPVASAATTVQLGTAAPFAVLAGSAVTDVPTSAITGNVGLSPAAGSFYAG